jgi:DNA glycosylase AlkZ-like
MRSIAERRLLHQGITGAGRRKPADVVAWSGAVQAQEYEAAKWALGLRLTDAAVDRQVEAAFERGEILRTHVLRPTWHFVTTKDIRWLLELTGPRVHSRIATYMRQMELDARTLARGTAVIERALGEGPHLTRTELRERLKRARISMSGIRLALVVMQAELDAVICSGPRRGKEFTYALLAERAPDARRLDRDEAIAELSRRYFSSHGPATVRDFVWWSGLTTADAKRGLDMIKADREELDGRHYWSLESSARALRTHPVHLLPIYDEYLVAYRDREAVPHGPRVINKPSKAVIFQHAVIIDGHVAGTWRTVTNARSVDVTSLRPLSTLEKRGLDDAIGRYQRFRGD